MAKTKSIKTATGLLTDAFRKVVPGGRTNEVGCNQLGPSGAKYFLPPECLQSISRASDALIAQCDGFPVERLAKEFVEVVIAVRDRTESPQAAHSAFRECMARTIAGFRTQTRWRALTAVSGLGPDMLPRTVGTVEFRIMDDHTYTETGKRISTGSATPQGDVAMWPEWEQDKLELRNRVVAFVDVEARDPHHARAKSHSTVQHAINAMRFAQIAGPFGHRPYPAIGVSEEPDRDERSLVFQFGRPAVGMQRALKGLGVVFAPLLEKSTLLDALSKMLAVHAAARTEMHMRMVAVLTWVGIAVEVESRPVQLISLVTALETLLIQRHESKGKTARLAFRIASLCGSTDAERDEIHEEWIQTSRLRNQCVHTGLEDCDEVRVKKAAKLAGRVVETLLTHERYRDCETLKEVVDALEASRASATLGRDEWIRRNAYFRWVNLGGHHGNSLQHWVDAERDYVDRGRRQGPSSHAKPS